MRNIEDALQLKRHLFMYSIEIYFHFKLLITRKESNPIRLFMLVALLHLFLLIMKLLKHSEYILSLNIIIR
jgi:hypothetical protein